MTSGPGVTVPNVPNPGSDGGTFEVTIVQSWSQETNYARVTQVNNFDSKHFPKTTLRCKYHQPLQVRRSPWWSTFTVRPT